MRSPIVWQHFEKELDPVKGYLIGKVLNAGCGDRDMTEYLKSQSADAVENCDFKSDIPGAIICDLESIPKQDSTYDSVLCNAVLEHVQNHRKVLAELKRVLKPGGYLVVSIPFLQPYHPNPGDYRRYTYNGMFELGKNNGFEVIEVLPVHSIAQALGWTLWVTLEEKRWRYLKAALWLPLHIWTRFSHHTDVNLKYNATGFQAVYRKPD